MVDNTISANSFRDATYNPWQQTNQRWFINLTDKDIPPNVTNLLQLGGDFSLPVNINKKVAIHEFIKDIESNSNGIRNLTSIRNAAIPQFSLFLKSNDKKTYTQEKLLLMHKDTIKFCNQNPNI